jgi:tRNA(His) guanylyltransferase
MAMSDALGDRMKLYEAAEAGRRLMPLLPVLARIDGRAFHSFTRGMDRPFDAKFSAAMVATTAKLVEETNSCMGYTQSDEITLAWHSTDPKSQIWFDGRIHKMASQLGAHATLNFYIAAQRLLPGFVDRLPTFDARVWSVPNRIEGANVFVWREWDATKNSISMAASEYYSDSQLRGVDGCQKQELLFQKGINWNDYPEHFKRGTYVQRRMVTRAFSAAEIESLPPRHSARSDPGLMVERWQIQRLALPPITQVENRVQVIFEGAAPKVQP